MAYLEPQNFNPFPKTPNSHVACHRKASFFSNFSSFFFDPGLTSCLFFFLSLPPLRERREASGRFLSPLPLPFSLFSFPASSDFTIFSFLIIEKPLLPSLTYSFHHTLLHRNPPEACLWAFFIFFCLLSEGRARSGRPRTEIATTLGGIYGLVSFSYS